MRKLEIKFHELYEQLEFKMKNSAEDAKEIERIRKENKDTQKSARLKQEKDKTQAL